MMIGETIKIELERSFELNLNAIVKIAQDSPFKIKSATELNIAQPVFEVSAIELKIKLPYERFN